VGDHAKCVDIHCDQVSPEVEGVLREECASPSDVEKLWVHGNRQFTVQIVTNLLSNAIKFTDEGTITLEFALAIAGDGDSNSPRGEHTDPIISSVETAEDSSPTASALDDDSSVGKSIEGVSVLEGTGSDGLLDGESSAKQCCESVEDGPSAVPAWINNGTASSSEVASQDNESVGLPAWINNGSSTPSSESTSNKGDDGALPSWINNSGVSPSSASTSERNDGGPVPSWINDGAQKKSHESSMVSEDSGSLPGWINNGAGTLQEQGSACVVGDELMLSNGSLEESHSSDDDPLSSLVLTPDPTGENGESGTSISGVSSTCSSQNVSEFDHTSIFADDDSRRASGAAPKNSQETINTVAEYGNRVKENHNRRRGGTWSQ